jgi:hypothetical protein
MRFQDKMNDYFCQLVPDTIALFTRQQKGP